MDQESISKLVPPLCPNQQPAIMVCLNPQCQHYAFFCLSCEDEKCQGVHQHKQHQDKLETMGFKMFLKRVMKPRQPSQELAKAATTYRETLQRLKKDVNEFVEKELTSLDQIMDEASTLPMEVQPILLRLQKQEYSGLKGKEMDFLWSNCGQSKESIQMQAQSAQFIAIKEEELKAISEHFASLNQLDQQGHKSRAVSSRGPSPAPSRASEKSHHSRVEPGGG